MFKINIADKSGKTFKLELETEEFMGKSIHDKVQGKDILPDLKGYEFEISGTSDKAGFTSMKDVPGIGLKKVLFTYGKAMKKRPRREGKKKRSNPTPRGLRLRKTVRGEVISSEITQINLKVLKEGVKKLAEVFPDQNKAREPKENRALKRKGAQKEPEKESGESEKSAGEQVGSPVDQPVGDNVDNNSKSQSEPSDETKEVPEPKPKSAPEAPEQKQAETPKEEPKPEETDSKSE